MAFKYAEKIALQSEDPPKNSVVLLIYLGLGLVPKHLKFVIVYTCHRAKAEKTRENANWRRNEHKLEK